MNSLCLVAYGSTGILVYYWIRTARSLGCSRASPGILSPGAVFMTMPLIVFKASPPGSPLRLRNPPIDGGPILLSPMAFPLEGDKG